MKGEDQLAVVREKLSNTSRPEREKLADKAGVSLRNLYNIVQPDSNPHYKVVYSLYNELNKAPRRRKSAEAQS